MTRVFRLRTQEDLTALQQRLGVVAKKPRKKYKNKSVEVDGITFDSALEARRYQDLKLLQFSGAIRDLEVHRAFRIEVGGMLICSYEADFCYTMVPSGLFVVEDTKGYVTPEYKLKKKLMKAVHKIDIREIK